MEPEASAPPPLAFPWARALPVFLALFAAIVGGANALAGDPAAAQAFDQALVRFAATAQDLQLHWLALSALATAVSLAAAWGLVRGADYA